MNVAEKKKKLRVDPADGYKARVQAVRPRLPKNYKMIIAKAYPEYDSHTGIILIQNVVAGKSADVKLTEILEQLFPGKRLKT